jgi:Flp pilus assembly protein TadG
MAFGVTGRSVFNFCRSTKAIAAIEFAIIFPIMIAVTLGSVETARFLTFSQRVDLVANTVVQMLTVTPICQSPLAPQTTPLCPAPSFPGTTVGYVNYMDLHTAQDSAMVIFPQVLQDAAQKGISWSSDIQISMASVQFNPSVCSAPCAKVTWNAGPNARACTTYLTKAASDSGPPSPTTLPPDLFPSAQALYSSAIVVDVSYTYTPLFTSKFFGSTRIQRSTYVTPRYVQLVLYDSSQSGDDGIGKVCP